IVAPTIVEVSSSEGFTAKNGLVLRNPAMVNFFDLCAISLPLPRAGGLPVGLMLVARNGYDRRLFRMAAAVERLFGAGQKVGSLPCFCGMHHFRLDRLVEHNPCLAASRVNAGLNCCCRPHMSVLRTLLARPDEVIE